MWRRLLFFFPLTLTHGFIRNLFSLLYFSLLPGTSRRSLRPKKIGRDEHYPIKPFQLGETMPH